MANRDYGSLTFSQQLRLLTAAIESRDPKRIARYLIPFAMLYDPETNGDEIRKNSATIIRSPLLDHVIAHLVNAKPLIFLKYLRILAHVDNYENDVGVDAIGPVVEIMERHKTDEEVLVSALKFLGAIRTEIGGNEDLIVMVVKLMESTNFRQSETFLTTALLFLANVVYEDVENKELVSVEAIPTILATLRTVADARTNLAALYVIKNLCTGSPREIVKDIVDNSGVSNIFKAIDRHSNIVSIVNTGLSCLVHLLHQRAKAKKQVTEAHLKTTVSVITKHKLKLDIMMSGVTLWLQLAKLSEKREWLGESVIEIVCGAMRQWSDNVELVCLSSILLERMMYTEANIDGLDAEEDIPLLITLLQKHPDESVMHLALLRLLCRLAEFPDAQDIIKASGGMTVLITAKSSDISGIRFWAKQTLDLVCQEDDTRSNSEQATSEDGASQEGSGEGSEEGSAEGSEEGSAEGSGEESGVEEGSEEGSAEESGSCGGEESGEEYSEEGSSEEVPQKPHEIQRKLEDQAREGERLKRAQNITQTSTPPGTPSLPAFADIDPTLPVWKQRLMQRQREQQLKQQQKSTA